MFRLLICIPMTSLCVAEEVFESEWLLPAVRFSAEHENTSRFSLTVYGEPDDKVRPGKLVLQLGAADFSVTGEPGKPGKRVELPVTLRTGKPTDYVLAQRFHRETQYRRFYSVYHGEDQFRITLALPKLPGYGRLYLLGKDGTVPAEVDLWSPRYEAELAEYAEVGINMGEYSTPRFATAYGYTTIRLSTPRAGFVRYKSNSHWEKSPGPGRSRLSWKEVEFRTFRKQGDQSDGQQILLRDTGEKTVEDLQQPPDVTRTRWIVLGKSVGSRHKMIFRDNQRVTRIVPLSSTTTDLVANIKRSLTAEKDKLATRPSLGFHRFATRVRCDDGFLKFAGLRGLTAQDAPLLTDLASLDHLRSLELTHSSISRRGLAAFRELWSLHLRDCRLTGETDLLSQLTELRSLYLDKSCLDLLQHDSISSLTQLQRINFWLGESQLPVSMYKAMAALPKLSQVSIFGQLDNESVAALANAKLLWSFQCPNAPTAAALRLYQAHPKLFGFRGHKIQLAGETVYLKFFSDEIAELLREGSPMQGVGLYGVRELNDSHLRDFSMWNVTRLDLSATKISDKGIAQLAGSDLEELKISDCKNLSTACLDSLKKCKRLKKLEIRRNAITLEEAIAALPGVEIKEVH